MLINSNLNSDAGLAEETLDDIYTQVLLDSAHHPQTKVSLQNPDRQAEARNSSCGDAISVELKLSPDGQIIHQVGWRGDGCIISQAHMEGLALALVGQKVTSLKTWTEIEMLKLFGLPNISPGRLKCLMLGLTAVKQALAK